MSGKVMGMVFEANLPRVEKFVLLAIADHADDDGLGCYASEARIVFKTGYDLSYVQKTIKRLQDRNVLVFSHKHPEYGVEVWDINLDALKPQTPFKTWVRTEWPEIMNKRPKSVGDALAGTDDCDAQQATDAPAPVTASEVDGPAAGNNARTSQEARPQPGNNSRSSENSARSSGNNARINLPIEPPHNNRQTPSGRSAKPLTPAMDARQNPAAKTRVLRERADSGADPDEWDIRARDRPQTALQTKIAQLTHSKYLSASTKATLRGAVTAVWGDSKRPVTHPSPEEEWDAHPELFAEYVELCARRIREESGRPPSRATLVKSIRNYARYNTGWLDFRKAAQEKARANPPPKERPWYYDPNKPDWMQ